MQNNIITINRGDAKSWITQQESELISKIMKDIEYSLMFGHSPNDIKRKHASQMSNYLWAAKIITLEEYGNISKMIHSNALEDLDFATTLIEQLSTQNSTQHVSNISSPEPQVSES